MCNPMFVDEFSNYIDRKEPGRILFASVDQLDNVVRGLPKFYFIFSSIYVNKKESTIRLEAGNGAITIDNVSRVDVREGESILGTIVIIYCESRDSAQYTLCLFE